MLLTDKELIYIHIPKTGGKSITQSLQRFTNRKIVGESVGVEDQAFKDLLIGNYNLNRNGPQALHHLTLEELVKYKYITKSQLKNYKIFSIVRNPYDRFLSAYNYHQMYKNFKNIESACKYIQENLYINNNSRLDNFRHFLPQINFLLYKGELVVKPIFRFETQLRSKHCVNFIKKSINYRGNDFFIDHINQTKYEIKVYNKKLINFVNEFYSQDFYYFNYNKIKY